MSLYSWIYFLFLLLYISNIYISVKIIVIFYSNISYSLVWITLYHHQSFTNFDRQTMINLSILIKAIYPNCKACYSQLEFDIMMFLYMFLYDFIHFAGYQFIWWYFGKLFTWSNYNFSCFIIYKVQRSIIFFSNFAKFILIKHLRAYKLHAVNTVLYFYGFREAAILR